MFENTRIFVKVVQQGSFSRAATLLGVPKSTVSRAVRSLEEEHQTRLLLRTTRSLSLTAAGRMFFDACLGPVQALEEAEKSLSGKDAEMAGHVKLTAPEDLGAHVISPALARLCVAYPQLTFEVNYSNEVIDLVRDGYDLAVRIGKLSTSSYRTRKVGVISLITVAAPSYIGVAPTISKPDDLAKHACLTLNLATIVPRWQLMSGRKSTSVAIKPSIICNQMTSLVRMAREGAGVALVPRYLVADYLAQGELVQLLPDWYQNHYPVSLVMPLSGELPNRLRLCANRLTEDIAAALAG